MDKITIVLISMMISFSLIKSVFSDDAKGSRENQAINENNVSNVLDNYYKEFNQSNSAKKECMINPDVFRTNVTLSNYYAEYLKSSQ